MPLPTTPALSRAGIASKNQNTLASMYHARAFPDPGASAFSATVSVVTVADTLAPKPVTGLSATAVAGGIRLDMTLPTLNADDSTLTDLTWLVIYYDPTDSIDVDDPGTYTGTFIVGATSQWTDRNVAEGATRYYKVVARDDAGNDSVASSEVSATAGVSGAVSIPADATGLVFDGNPKVGDAMLGLIFESPAITWDRFLHWEIQYAVSTDSGSSFGAWTALTKTTAPGYVHKGLTTTSTYRYKYRGRPVGEDGTASTTWDESDNGGTGWPNAGTWGADNSAIVGETVIAELVVATNEVRAANIKAGSVTATEMAALTITAAVIHADAITTVKINGLAVTHGKAAENAVRTYEFQVDEILDHNSKDSMNFTGARAGTDADDDYLSLTNRRWYGYVNTEYSEINLGSDAALRGYNDLDIDAQHGDLYLRAGDGAGDYIILEMVGAGASSQLQIQDWVGDGGTYEGYVKVYLKTGAGSWVTRYIRLQSSA
ncbi:hypothetical protein KKA53_05040 [Candidatus Dependentiae bacterium]|nr:hypothetical protein [Candidatus Dependentiae bacterium]